MHAVRVLTEVISRRTQAPQCTILPRSPAADKHERRHPRTPWENLRTRPERHAPAVAGPQVRRQRGQRALDRPVPRQEAGVAADRRLGARGGASNRTNPGRGMGSSPHGGRCLLSGRCGARSQIARRATDRTTTAPKPTTGVKFSGSSTGAKGSISTGLERNDQSVLQVFVTGGRP